MSFIIAAVGHMSRGRRRHPRTAENENEKEKEKEDAKESGTAVGHGRVR
jgi:hypothetical protein